jgi:hypothetical protein
LAASGLTSSIRRLREDQFVPAAAKAGLLEESLPLIGQDDMPGLAGL